MIWPRFPYGGRDRAGPGPAPGESALEVQGASATYAGTSTPALQSVDLRVPPGARVALVGPNGSGKSTLLKVAAGLLPLSVGHARVFGRQARTGFQWVAYLPQHDDVDWRFPISVRRMVLTGRYGRLGWLRRPGPGDLDAASYAMERLGLGPVSERQIGELSGGQQQRTLLARTLAQGADLLLLDEPLNAVDADTRSVFSEVLEDLRLRQKTVVVATHDLGRLEADFDGALYLNEGREAMPHPGAFVGLQVGSVRV